MNMFVKNDRWNRIKETRMRRTVRNIVIHKLHAVKTENPFSEWILFHAFGVVFIYWYSQQIQIQMYLEDSANNLVIQYYKHSFACSTFLLICVNRSNVNHNLFFDKIERNRVRSSHCRLWNRCLSLSIGILWNTPFVSFRMCCSISTIQSTSVKFHGTLEFNLHHVMIKFGSMKFLFEIDKQIECSWI